MKKAILIFAIVAMVLVTCVFWFITSGAHFNPTDLFPFGIIAIILVFAVFVGIKQISNAKRGEPTEDELSKKVKIKAAAMSYYVSLYWLLVLMYISDKYEIETHAILAVAILGMAIFWAGFWFFYNLKGVKNE